MPTSLRTKSVALMSRDWFERVEHVFYLVIGVFLAIAAALSVLGAAYVLLTGIHPFQDGDELVELTDRLLIGLMLVEIMHTVRVSIREGGLSPEPFLIVGLIASIRRVLVITLESSQATNGTWNDQTETLFRASMIELGVLAALIMVMVISIFLLKRSNTFRPHPRALLLGDDVDTQ